MQRATDGTLGDLTHTSQSKKGLGLSAGLKRMKVGAWALGGGTGHYQDLTLQRTCRRLGLRGDFHGWEEHPNELCQHTQFKNKGSLGSGRSHREPKGGLWNQSRRRFFCILQSSCRAASGQAARALHDHTCIHECSMSYPIAKGG